MRTAVGVERMPAAGPAPRGSRLRLERCYLANRRSSPSPSPGSGPIAGFWLAIAGWSRPSVAVSASSTNGLGLNDLLGPAGARDLRRCAGGRAAGVRSTVARCAGGTPVRGTCAGRALLPSMLRGTCAGARGFGFGQNTRVARNAGSAPVRGSCASRVAAHLPRGRDNTAHLPRRREYGAPRGYARKADAPATVAGASACTAKLLEFSPALRGDLLGDRAELGPLNLGVDVRT